MFEVFLMDRFQARQLGSYPDISGYVEIKLIYGYGILAFDIIPYLYRFTLVINNR